MTLPPSLSDLDPEADSEPELSRLTLVVGGDWRTGDSYPKQDPKASDPLKDTESVNGADKGACMEVYAPYRF